jgi:mannose-6-phosphate isomerase
MGAGALAALTFEPHFEERVWGGRRLERHGRKLPPGARIGETWEISAIPGRSSVIGRGPYRGRALLELVENEGSELLGRGAGPRGTFPLLFKLLDAREPLSVQLHPRDAEAVLIEGEGPGSAGKAEAWLILESEPGAEIIHGLAPGVEREELYRRLAALGGARLPLEEERASFRWVRVEAGDVVHVPAGTLHALGAGVVLLEVQQSSDLTYRIYDWGRRDAAGRCRELHIEKARRVRPAGAVACPAARIPEASGGAAGSRTLLDCEEFELELVALGKEGRRSASTGGAAEGSFEVLIGWSGAVLYEGPGGDRLEIEPLSFVLLPAALGAYELRAAGGAASCLVVRPG